MVSDIYNTPCTKKPQNYNPNQELFMVGKGNSEACKSLVKSIFDFECPSSQQCSFNGVQQPPVSGDFMVTWLKRRGAEKQGWRETVTVSTVPARRTPDTSLWRGRCWSTALQRWRSSPALSGSSVILTGKWYVPVTSATVTEAEARVPRLLYGTTAFIKVVLIIHHSSFI